MLIDEMRVAERWLPGPLRTVVVLGGLVARLVELGGANAAAALEANRTDITRMLERIGGGL